MSMNAGFGMACSARGIGKDAFVVNARVIARLRLGGVDDLMQVDEPHGGKVFGWRAYPVWDACGVVVWIEGLAVAKSDDLLETCGGIEIRTHHINIVLGHDGNPCLAVLDVVGQLVGSCQDRKSTRLNSSHVATSYAVFCWQKQTP